MTLGDIILQYRTQHGVSMEQFAKLSGISKGYISMLERNITQRGDVPSPSIDMYRSVAKTIGMDVDELIRIVEDIISLGSLPQNIIPMPKTTKIPLLGTIACGTPILADENIEDYVGLPEHVCADFALRCKGDSMINARVFDGDIVYIKKQPTVNNGEIAAVLIGDEATLKYVNLYPNKIVLEAANPTFEDIVCCEEEMNDVIIMGKAVAFTSLVRAKQNKRYNSDAD